MKRDTGWETMKRGWTPQATAQNVTIKPTPAYNEEDDSWWGEWSSY